MGVNISRKQGQTYLQEDQRWLKGGVLYAPADGGLIDVALFTAATHFPNGFIPAGMFVGRVTATGLVGPYVAAATDGRQTVVGAVLTSVDVPAGATTGKIGCAIAVRCDVITNYLPANNGLDAAARTALADHMRFFTYNHVA